MTMMAAMPIYGKKPFKDFLPWNQWNNFNEAWGLLAIKVCSNYYPGLTLTYFTARSNFATSAFISSPEPKAHR